jgi:hypothetical protein
MVLASTEIIPGARTLTKKLQGALFEHLLPFYASRTQEVVVASGLAFLSLRFPIPGSHNIRGLKDALSISIVDAKCDPGDVCPQHLEPIIAPVIIRSKCVGNRHYAIAVADRNIKRVDMHIAIPEGLYPAL